jgi:hypothetical protein
MIRIETTATFDAEGHISIHDRIAVTVVPGTHRVVREVIDDQPIDGRQAPALVGFQEHGLLLINAAPIPGSDLSVRRLMEGLRDDRQQGLIDGDIR